MFALDLDPLACRGFARSGDAFAPLAEAHDLAAAGAALLVEAEQADERVGGEVVREGDAAAVVGAQVLRFNLLLPAGGKPLTLWARVRQAEADAAVLIDWGAEPEGWGTVTWTSRKAYADRGEKPEAANRKNAGQWRWERLCPPVVRRRGGLHRLELKAVWPGMPDVDRLLIVTDDSKPEAVAAKAARAALTEWTLASVPLRHSAARRLISAELVGQGAVEIEASTDGGRSWRPARDVDLPDGRFILRARFSGDRPPAVRARRFDCRVAMAAEGRLHLATPRAAVELDLQRHGVFRLSDPGRHYSMLRAVEAVPLFSLELKQRGQDWPKPRKVLSPGADGELLRVSAMGHGDSAEAALDYAFLDGKLAATVRIKAEGAALTWQLELDNRSEWDVLTCSFPRLAGLKVGDSAADDRFVNTNIYGPWPAAFPPGDRTYPGWASLGWCDLYDPGGGVSLAVRECVEGQTTFRLRGDYGMRQTPETAVLEAVKEHCVPGGAGSDTFSRFGEKVSDPFSEAPPRIPPAPGGRRTWTYAMLLHGGDWHVPADDYRRWFTGRFGVADHWPDWLLDGNGWIAVNPSLADATFKWPMLLDSFEQGRRLGLMHLQVWGQFGASCCGSFFWPSPKYGPIDEFADTMAEIRRRGGHVGGYFLYDRFNRYNLLDKKTWDGYLPKADYPPDVPNLTVDQFRQAMLVDDPAGRLTGWPQDAAGLAALGKQLDALHAAGKLTRWADGGMMPMNVREPVWRDWLTSWAVDWYARRWHCDSPYFDVLGCHTLRTFDPRRDEDGQFFGGGEMELARHVVEAGRKADPGFALIAEGKNELVTRWAAGMTSSQHPEWIQLDAHRFTHPDHILFLGAQNGGYQQLVDNTLRAFLYGAKFDLMLMGDVNRLRQIVGLRRPFIRFVSRARYRDARGVLADGRGVEARRFDRFTNGCKATTVCVINPDEVADGRLHVDASALAKGKYGAFWLRSDGTAATVKLPGGPFVSTPIPPTCASALLLVAQPPAGEELLAAIDPFLDVQRAKARFWIANLSPASRRVEVRFAADGLDERRTYDLPAFGLAADLLDWPAGEAAGCDVLARIGDRTLAAGYLWPIVEDGSFERYPIAPAGGEPFEGKRFVRFPPAEGWQGTYRLLNVRPGCRYHVSVMARRTGARGKMYGLVRLRSRSRGWQYTTMNFPPEPLNRWAKLEVDATAPADLCEADVYLYNCESRETVDYDALKVQMTASPAASETRPAPAP